MKEKDKTYFSVVTFRDFNNLLAVENGELKYIFKPTEDIKDPYTLMGIFFDKEKAIEEILANKCGFDESWTDYCALEEIGEGFYRQPINITFFKYNQITEKFEFVLPGQNQVIDAIHKHHGGVGPTPFGFSC